jgi:3-dehydroquinate synthase
MKNIQLELPGRSYEILIRNGLLREVGQRLASLGTGRTPIIVSHPHLWELHGKILAASLAAAGMEVPVVTVSEGEQNKNLSTLELIWRQLVRLRADRRTLLIAFGGGVIGDMTGFAAAAFLRGIDYLQVPTTLLAQIDSSIGGKTGVNLGEGKNLVGAFHQPKAVWIDPELLSTLPPRELNSGLFEAIKYGVIWDRTLFDLVCAKAALFPKLDPIGLEQVIAGCAAIKAEVVSQDEKEGRLRMVLNFGHTLGHALEAATDYSLLTHGEAVGHGMILAARLALRMGMLAETESRQIESALRKLAPLPSLSSLTWEEIRQPMLADKKFSGSKLRFVLPIRIGSVAIVDDTPLVAVENTVREYLAHQSRN